MIKSFFFVFLITATFFLLLLSGSFLSLNGMHFASAKEIKYLTSEDCASAGFVKGVVQCIDCERLLRHTGSIPLYQECLLCCGDSNKTKESQKQYRKAVKTESFRREKEVVLFFFQFPWCVWLNQQEARDDSAQIVFFLFKSACFS